MKNKTLILLIACLLISSLFLVACDSSGGRSDNVYLTGFRFDGQFILPIKVTKATMEPDPIKYFNSKMSLSQIYESINKDERFEAELYDDYVLIKDLSTSKLGYCIIKPYIFSKYNYLVTNMGLHVYPSGNRSIYKLVLVPLHLISVPIEVGEIDENEKYNLCGTKKDVIDFYEANGYEVKDTDAGLIVTDITGINYSGTISYDDVWEKLEIKIEGSKVNFVLL